MDRGAWRALLHGIASHHLQKSVAGRPGKPWAGLGRGTDRGVGDEFLTLHLPSPPIPSLQCKLLPSYGSKQLSLLLWGLFLLRSSWSVFSFDILTTQLTCHQGFLLPPHPFPSFSLDFPFLLSLEDRPAHPIDWCTISCLGGVVSSLCLSRS